MFSFFKPFKLKDESDADRMIPDLPEHKLILSLRKEHREQLKLVNAIAISAERERLPEAFRRLKVFKTAFSDHFLREDLEFYQYLESHYPEESDGGKLLKEFRARSEGFADGVMGFINRYGDGPPEVNKITIFLAELQVVANALAERIYWEEVALYPLYHDLLTQSDSSVNL